MIKGLGIDIIEISRIKEAVEKYGDSFLTKVYTPGEIKYCKSAKAYRFPELAVRFAAKEAYSKALGTGIRGFGKGRGKGKGGGVGKGGVGWKDIEIINDKLGKPYIALRGKVSKNLHVSLAHSQTSATAVVVIEK